MGYIDNLLGNQATNGLAIGLDLSYKNSGIAGIYCSGMNFKLYDNLWLASVEGIKEKGRKSNKNIVDLIAMNDMADKVCKKVCEIIDNCKKVNSVGKIIVGVEYGYMTGGRSYQLSLLSGAVLNQLNNISGVELRLVNVSSARKLLNIKRKDGDIKLVIYKLWEQLGVKCNNYDESDALTIAYYLARYIMYG